MSTLSGPYIGFKFGDVHSSDLGIVRVSDGSRYIKNLLPNIQEKTVSIPGSDGTYYFDTYYTQRQFSISIAFHGITQSTLNRMHEIFSTKIPQKLIFDEDGDKYIIAKPTGSPQLKFVYFENADDRPEVELIHTHKLNSTKVEVIKNLGGTYSGEGTLNFVAYDPYFYRENTIEKSITANKGTFNPVPINMGVYESPFQIGLFNILQKTTYTAGDITIQINHGTGLNETEDVIKIDAKNLISGYNPFEEGNYGICLTSTTGLVTNAALTTSKIDTGTMVYNNYVRGNTTFGIKPGKFNVTVSASKPLNVKVVFKLYERYI